MRLLGVFGAVQLVATAAAAQAPDSTLQSMYRDEATQIIDRLSRDSEAYDRLADLVDRFGHRFSGSESLENAIDWILEKMEADGLENVRGQKVMVPHWVRGRESLEIVSPRPRTIPMLGLGGSIATPPEGIEADLLVVSSFDDLRDKADQAAGRIVLFNVPFTSYGETVGYRGLGAIEAAKVGAVASLVRSVTPYSMQTPHTGAMRYDESTPKIPHAAITIEDAEYFAREQARGIVPRVRLYMQAQTLPDAPSRNVVAELRGTEYPDEVVVMGGHIDSWDVGQGAMDDAGGCVAAWEALRILQELGLRARRTIRVVMWTNEENGLRGGRVYRDSVADAIENHILAIESDAGVFSPTGFGFSGSDAAFDIVTEIGELLDPIGAGEITRGGGGADIGPLMQEGVPGAGLVVDRSRYFWYHHTDADTIDKLDPDEVARSAAALAVLAYVVADMPERLPR
ncbi:MAG TPA: M28 family metallopeptidase [Rhodothermales bacterium]|nr:M28 family metallopeptidase [Rhodothermales bacterium]